MKNNRFRRRKTAAVELPFKANLQRVKQAKPSQDRSPEFRRESEAGKWSTQNRRAVEAYNKRVEQEGVWSDELRGF